MVYFAVAKGYEIKPIGLAWRSSTRFILATVAIGLFTDLFLFGLIVPVLPFILRDRLHILHSSIQENTSLLLACYAGAAVIFSLPIGILADRLSSRRLPYSCGVASLFAATVLLWLGQELWVLVIARILQGISGAVVWTVGMALVMDTVGSEQLGQVVGSIFSFISVGELMAPLVGGVLYNEVGEWAVFVIGLALLVVDLAMRFILIEKRVAARYMKQVAYEPGAEYQTGQGATEEDEEATESTTLLGKDDSEIWVIPEQPNWVKSFPIVYCLSDMRFLTALITTFANGMLLGLFDATVPTEAQDLYNVNPLQSGLLFMPLVLPYLITGPLAGRGVDKYGVKPIMLFGFLWTTIPLFLFRLTNASTIVLFCVLLALSGIGLGFITSPGIVEATDVIENYHKANKGFFGENGPYAQMYAFNSMFFCAGLSAGPLVSGWLRIKIGYGNMNACFAVLCLATAALGFVFMGGRPRILQR